MLHIDKSSPVVQDSLDAEIVAYWNERSIDYSSCILQELKSPQYYAWRRAIKAHTDAHQLCATQNNCDCRVLDIGCGPGFFSILLAQMGFVVDAVDSSPDMLAQAQTNSSNAKLAHRIALHHADACHLPFSKDVFDVVILRNVTWLMRDLRAAYGEWQRVLKPGGLLLVFDANWYLYVADEALNAQRLSDEHHASVRREEVNGFATQRQEEHCEQIARNISTTYMVRPQFDVELLSQLGFCSIATDEQAYTMLWTPEEQQIYGSTPLFCISAQKAMSASANVTPHTNMISAT